jgi:hypothetical protein
MDQRPMAAFFISVLENLRVELTLGLMRINGQIFVVESITFVFPLVWQNPPQERKSLNGSQLIIYEYKKKYIRW